MEKTWSEWTKRELLKLPKRDWNKETSYDSALLVNTRMKHDSGYNLFAVIGCYGDEPIEIVGYMDDFRLYPVQNKGIIEDLAIDCSMYGVFRIHSMRTITIGSNTSTTFWNIGNHITETK